MAAKAGVCVFEKLENGGRLNTVFEDLVIKETVHKSKHKIGDSSINLNQAYFSSQKKILHFQTTLYISFPSNKELYFNISFFNYKF